MKRWFIRAAALSLALSIQMTTAGAAEILQTGTLPLSDSMSLTESYLLEEETLQEYAVSYTPGMDVRPMVVFGSTLYGRSTMDYIADYLKDRGQTPVAGINAAFFDMSNGLPIGMVVTDGILRINGQGTVVGVEADGSVRIGSPTLQVRGSWKKYELGLHYNQLLEGNGLVLYSRDYDSKTKGGVPGYHVVLQAESSSLAPNSVQRLTVTDIAENKALCTIPEDGFLLSIAEDSPLEHMQQAIRSLEIGDTLTLTVSIDPDWEDVQYVVGAGDLLVEQGSPCAAFTLDSAKRQAARTALGLKANGDVVLYALDRSRLSAGMTLAQLADRMAELGCVTAVNLDGGGSTCMGVTLPGETTFSTVNHPSDGSQRPCANYLFFVRPTTSSGPATKLFMYPYDAALLPGGQVELTAKAADSSYMPAEIPGFVQWRASGGTVANGVFTAAQPGTAHVTAQSGSLSGSVTIQVVETPTAMEVLREDRSQPVEKIRIESGTSLDLTARAWYHGLELAARDTSYQWSRIGEIGTVDSDGFFTASDREIVGVLMVSCGDAVTRIPVEVRMNPMTDLEGHWARECISDLYFRGVVNGSINGAGEMVYRPDVSMTRQEFIVALIRWLQVDTAEYASEELPFADTGEIADWAMDAMKAAYALGYLTGSSRGERLYAEPSATITREAAMTILARSQGVSSDSDALKTYADASRVSDWARASLTAMVERGIINGIDGKLQPQGQVTRAQVAKMLYWMA